MTSLFGISMDSIARVLLALVVLITLALVLLALRHRLLLKLGLRNIPRRRVQSILIVVGLMLATTIVTSAFATGDTISYSIRSLATTQLGAIDEVVSRNTTRLDRAVAAPVPAFFSGGVAARARAILAPTGDADGITGVIVQPAPLQDLTSRQTKAAAQFLGLSSRTPAAFGGLRTVAGAPASVGRLGGNAVYLNQNAAIALNAHAGDRLLIYAGSRPVHVTVQAVVRNEGLATGFLGRQLQSNPEVLMPLARAQSLTGHPGQITAILISNRGDALAGATLSNRVARTLSPLHGYSVEKVKQDVLDSANQAGTEFTSGFITFGLFSIAAGIMLIFLLFVMLAAERRTEMGISRAIGTKRRHLIEQFLFEGYVYDLGAAIVGVIVGIGVGLGMVSVLASLLQSGGNFALIRHIEPRSMIVAFCLGALVTFLTVAGSCWRVSRLNVVAAIRDLPDEVHVDGSIRGAFGLPFADLGSAGRRLRRGRILSALAAIIAAPWHLLLAFRVFISRGPLLVLAGYLLFALGNQDKQAFPYTLGISLMLIGAAMLIRWALGGLGVRAGRRNRIGYTLAGLSLVGFWLLPFDFFRSDLSIGIEMFFLSGMLLMLGGVWTAMYNLDLILAGLLRVTGGARSLTPILRTAISYPGQHRLRTGLTVFMFSLVVFALMVEASLIGSFGSQTLDLNRSYGRYQIYGDINSSTSISHLQRRIAADPSLRGSIVSAGGIGVLDAALWQGNEQRFRYPVNVAGDAYLAGTHFSLHARATGYPNDASVWHALAGHPGYAVIDSLLAQTGGRGGNAFPGVAYKNTRFVPFTLEMRDRRTRRVIPLRVIGEIDPQSGDNGVYISAGTLAAAHDRPVLTTRYYFRVASGHNVHRVALALGSAFLPYGLDTQEVQAVYDRNNSLNVGFNTLLEGFMALGLIVGVAALGVVATRSVVERRQQIGVLRAIGFRREMVRRSFLIESSFVCLLGTVIGVVLGLLLGYQVVAYFGKTDAGLQFHLPWLTVTGIVIATYLACLLTTYLPAWQASRTYPAEALRYE